VTASVAAAFSSSREPTRATHEARTSAHDAAKPSSDLLMTQLESATPIEAPVVHQLGMREWPALVSCGRRAAEYDRCDHGQRTGGRQDSSSNVLERRASVTYNAGATMNPLTTAKHDSAPGGILIQPLRWGAAS
jgi:hypothetical protein